MSFTKALDFPFALSSRRIMVCGSSSKSGDFKRTLRLWLAISKEALLQVNGKFYFFIHSEGILSRREISNPQFMGSDLIAIENVQVNDQIVISPMTKLRDGMSVKVRND